MNLLAICVATMHPRQETVYPGDISLATANAVTGPKVYVQYNTPEDNLGIVRSYDKLYRESTEEILCFMHDDVIVRERGWDERILKEFESEECAVVGAGGALWHGNPELYKTTYRLQNLRRGDYLSNVDDAEIHGERFTGSCDVAVLDGFSLVIRRSFLDRIDGWNRVGRVAGFFCYDYAICALARRLGYRIRCVGIRCHHRGGQTSVNGEESVQKITSTEEYEKSHRLFYEEFRDVMPCRVKP